MTSRPPLPPPKVAFTRLDELSKDESETILIYGGSKTGKTWFFGTAGDRTLIIDTGDGIKTLRSPMFKSLVKSNPIVVQISEKIGPRGVPELANAFDLVCDTIDYALEKFPGDFDTICVDELSALRRYAMYKGMEYNQSTGKSHSLSKIAAAGAMMPAVQDYGAEMSLIEQFCSSYTKIAKQCGKHFILAGHQRFQFEKPKNREGNPIIGEAPVTKEVRPAVTGAQFTDTITALFDNVWRTERSSGGDTTVYRMRILGDEIIVAGTRHAGVFPTLLRRPNFLEILSHIRSGVPMKDIPDSKPQTPK